MLSCSAVEILYAKQMLQIFIEGFGRSGTETNINRVPFQNVTHGAIGITLNINLLGYSLNFAIGVIR